MSDAAGERPDLSGLSAWAPELAEAFVTLASDVALLLDNNGIITSVAVSKREPMAPWVRDWIGRPWVETATSETRAKIDLLLKEASTAGLARRREVNHRSSDGNNVPIAYTALRLGIDGPVLAVGHDLRAVAAIQQRFVDAQQDLERSYWRTRQAESRHGLMSQVATDALLVVDAQTLKILESNQAASQLFDLTREQLNGRPVTFGFERQSREAVELLLTSTRAVGQPAEIRARLIGQVTMASITATPFRTEHAMRLLVRVRAASAPAAPTALNAALARLVDSTRDGIVVTDSGGRILVANPAFIGLVKPESDDGLQGHRLGDWIEVPDGGVDALLAQVRRQGILRRVACRLIQPGGGVLDIALAASLLTEGDQECIGFTIHPQRADAADTAEAGGTEPAERFAARAAAGLAAALGVRALPQLMREASALAELALIEQALQRCSGDESAAATLLGISRRSLQRRLRRAAQASAGAADRNAVPDSR